MPHVGQKGILIHSGGFRLLGTLFLAWGDQPKPTAVLLHGLPGIELNHDIALALRDRGWNCLIFHYRGCGGSGGPYGVQTLVADVRAAVDELSSGRHPQVDPDRLVLIGHSMGGWAAVREAAWDPRVKAVAAVCAAADPGALPFADPQTAREITDFLQGITAESFIEQWRALDAGQSASRLAARITPRPLLVIHAGDDEIVPVAQGRELYERAGEPRQLIVHPEANHSFTRHRPWLRKTLLAWLAGLEKAVPPRCSRSAEPHEPDLFVSH